MPIVELNHRWVFTSTGHGARQDGLTVQEWTFYSETAAGTTCTIELMTAQGLDSSYVGVVIGSSEVLGASETVVQQFTGPFAAVWPRVVGMTSSGTVTVRGLAV